MRTSKEREDGGGDSERRLLERARATTGRGVAAGVGYGMGAAGRNGLCVRARVFWGFVSEWWIVVWGCGLVLGGGLFSVSLSRYASVFS